MEIETDRVAHAERIGLEAAAVDVHARDLRIGLRGNADVTGRAHIDVELVVGPERYELPAVRLVVRELVVDDDRLRRIVEIVLDVLELRDLGPLRDVERALAEGEAVRSIQPRGQDLELGLAALVDQIGRASCRERVWVWW